MLHFTLKALKPTSFILLPLSILCFVFYHPIAVEGRFINSLTLNRRTDNYLKFLSKLNDKNILIIASRPGQYTALGYGAINFANANSTKQSLLNEASRRLYSKIIAFQEIEYQTTAPNADTALDPEFKLKTLYEIQCTATDFLRISEVQLPDAQPQK